MISLKFSFLSIIAEVNAKTYSQGYCDGKMLKTGPVTGTETQT